MYVLLPCLNFFTLSYNYCTAIFWIMVVILFTTLIVRGDNMSFDTILLFGILIVSVLTLVHKGV